MRKLRGVGVRRDANLSVDDAGCEYGEEEAGVLHLDVGFMCKGVCEFVSLCFCMWYNVRDES